MLSIFLSQKKKNHFILTRAVTFKEDPDGHVMVKNMNTFRIFKNDSIITNLNLTRGKMKTQKSRKIMKNPIRRKSIPLLTTKELNERRS